MNKQKRYAYMLTNKNKWIIDNRPDCQKIVSGSTWARYKWFTSKTEAQQRLELWADYKIKNITSSKWIYFDAGTGRWNWVEISVTDNHGNNLLDKVINSKKLNNHGKLLLDKDKTNNFGELLACKYALQISKDIWNKNIYWDSKLIINSWSKWSYNQNTLPQDTIKLIQEVILLRQQFEKNKWTITRISWSDNPADLWFHK